MSEERRPWGIGLRTYLILLHLSQLSGYIVPFGGLVLPLVMWLTNKDEFPEVDRHGREVMNWILSAIIYLIVSVVLILVFIGILGVFAVALLSIVFAIIGAIKASEDKVWEYPLAIRFFKAH